MKKFLILCCVFAVSAFAAAAQTDSTKGFVEASKYGEMGSVVTPYIHFYDTRGYVTERDMDYYEAKYPLYEVKVVITTSDNKKYEYSCPKDVVYVAIDKALAGQKVKMEVSKEGYKSLETEWVIPAGVEPHVVDGEQRYFYPSSNVYLMSESDALPPHVKKREFSVSYSVSM